jgi:hypothetical protein
MSILQWEQPEKELSTEQWKEIAADNTPPGVYSPNMSSADIEKWKAKLVGTKSGYPRVEIRKGTTALMLIIVSLGQGFQQKYKGMPEGTNIQMSMNGASAMTWQEWDDFNQAIQEAKAILEALP